MSQLCACGCGYETTICTKDDKRIGAVKGQPNRFLKGHKVRKGTVQEIIDDVKRVLALTECHEFPSGDTRGTTYFTPGIGKFCRDAIYAKFGDYAAVLEYIFPDGVFKRNNKNKTAVEAVRQYVYEPRTCLKCDRTFMSWAPENRKCEHCLNLPSYTQGDDDGETYQFCIPGMGGTLT